MILSFQIELQVDHLKFIDLGAFFAYLLVEWYDTIVIIQKVNLYQIEHSVTDQYIILKLELYQRIEFIDLMNYFNYD